MESVGPLGSPVILVSAFGRGHWLAAALAQEGIKTILIDVSNKLGVWPAEDIEGPFGLFRTEKISEGQVERLYCEDSFEEAVDGFSLWLKSGPFELKGPLTKYRLEKSTLSPQVQDQLLQNPAHKNKSIYKNTSFKESWLLHLAHQWASSTYVPNAHALLEGRASPLVSPFMVRHATRGGYEKSFQWLKSKGVEVIRPQDVLDISFQGRNKISGIELSGSEQGLFKLDKMIWLLSSEETYYLNEKVGEYFFPQGALEPEWSWIRYRVGLNDCTERKALPLHMVVLEDVDSPWTHENMMIIQRTALADQFDVWMRIPTVQRFNKEYLADRSQAMIGLLLQRMPLSQPQVLSFPQEYYYTYAQLGPSRYPVFAAEVSSRRGQSEYVNLYLDGPELWTQYSWDIYFEAHQNIKLDVLVWWQEKVLREQKEKRKEQST